MSGPEIVALISGITSVISFVLFVFNFIIYRILENPSSKTETTIGYYENMKNTTYISRGKRVINNNAIYKYTVNDKAYYKKWDASDCQKAPIQKPVTYIKKFPRISKVENDNKYLENYVISIFISVCTLALALLVVFS